MKKFSPLVWLFLFLGFACGNDQIPPGFSKSAPKAVSEFQNTVSVESRQMVQMVEAVGTLRPLTQSVIESQVAGQVLKVLVVPGALVTPGQILIHLDDRQLSTRYEQAREGLTYALNTLTQA